MATSLASGCARFVDSSRRATRQVVWNAADHSNQPEDIAEQEINSSPDEVRSIYLSASGSTDVKASRDNSCGEVLNRGERY
jgi:hypothetical protein